jgi:hypothetical protein
MTNVMRALSGGVALQGYDKNSGVVSCLQHLLKCSRTQR